MELTARSPSCFSNRYVLRYNGLPIGEFVGRWFSEGIDIRLTDRRRWRLERRGFLNASFFLIDDQNQQFGTAQHRSRFSSRWDLETSVGGCTLASAGLFNTGYVLEQGDQVLAEVRQINHCEGGWSVVAGDTRLNLADLLMAGMIYHVILQRRRSSHAAAG